MRARLAEVFGSALIERDAAATADQVARTCEKAYRSPLLLLLIIDGLRGGGASRGGLLIVRAGLF